MKELLTDYGGRRWYNEDFLNLQDLALSATQFLTNAGTDFIVSGCQITTANTTDANGKSICNITMSEGYVLIGNKVRHVEKQTVSSVQLSYPGPFYIVGSNAYGPKIVYASGATKEQYIEYGAKLSIVQPSGSTGYIRLASKDDDTKSFAKAFIGAYATLKNDTDVKTVTTARNLPVDCRLVMVHITADDTMSLSAIPAGGSELKIIAHNPGSSDITLTLPDSGCVCFGEPPYVIQAGKYMMLDAVSDGTTVYLRCTTQDNPHTEVFAVRNGSGTEAFAVKDGSNAKALYVNQ